MFTARYQLVAALFATHITTFGAASAQERIPPDGERCMPHEVAATATSPRREIFYCPNGMAEQRTYTNGTWSARTPYTPREDDCEWREGAEGGTWQDCPGKRYYACSSRICVFGRSSPR